MKVITPRDTTTFMGPLGAGPMLWNVLKESWMLQHEHLRCAPIPRKRVERERMPWQSPVSTRYYSALDDINTNKRWVCRQPCLLCEKYIHNRGQFP